MLRCKWKWSGPAGFGNRPSWRSSKSEATRSQWRPIWSTSTNHRITVKRMLQQGALGPRAGSATVHPSGRTAVAWCAAEGATTLTSTPRCGSATASSTGVALWNATPAANGQKCSLASNLKMEQPEHGHNPPFGSVEQNNYSIILHIFLSFFLFIFFFLGGKGVEPISFICFLLTQLEEQCIICWLELLWFH